MQKGFASLEIILAVLIIALLVTVAVPNAARVLDKAALDYEQKRLYSELYFLRVFDRSATVMSTGMNKYFFSGKKSVTSSEATMYFDFYANGYQIFREGQPVREPHHLSYGVFFSDETDAPAQIYFDSRGAANKSSATIVLRSRRNYKATIVIDSVGRIRGGK